MITVNRAIHLPMILFISVVATTVTRADDTTTIGFRAGFETDENLNEDFQRYEVYLYRGLPWSWGQRPWSLGTRLDASIGVLEGGDDTGFFGSVGPSVVLNRAGFPLSLEVGVGITVLNDEEFGDEQFGSEFQFNSHIGANYHSDWGWTVGYRFHHMSNAGIEDPNPGLTMHMFNLGYRF